MWPAHRVICAGPFASLRAGGFRQTVVVTAAARPVELGSVTRTHDGHHARADRRACRCSRWPTCCGWPSSVDVRCAGERGVQTDFAVRGANFGQMLVLVDGVRLNDAQSGHHNGDIPVPLDAVERIEVLHGPGLVALRRRRVRRHGQRHHPPRRVEPPSLRRRRAAASGSSAGRGQVGFERGAVREVARGVAPIVRRASCTTATSRRRSSRSRTSLGDATELSVSYLWKEFGANNFYGGNAPSREWTNQTLVAADHRFGDARGWSIDGDARRIGRTATSSSSTSERPRLSDNRHRTHAVLGVAQRRRGASATAASLTVGVEGGGDWIRSTNLGDHATARVSGFGEWRQEIGAAHAARRQRCASIATTSSARRGTRRSASAGGRRPTRAAARLGRPRVPRADVHRALLLGSREPGARGGRPRDGVGRRGRRRRVPAGRLDRCRRRSSAGPTTT